jgi:hypothetical protein
MEEDSTSSERFHEVCGAVRSWIRFCRGVAIGNNAGEPFDAIDALADVGLLACRKLRCLSGVADKRTCPVALKVAGRKRVWWPVDVTAGIGKNTGEGESLKAMAAAVELGADRAIDVEETEHLCHVAIPDADFVKEWLKACTESACLGDLQGAEFLVTAGLEICAVLDELSQSHPAIVQQVARYRLSWPVSLTCRASRDAWRAEFSAIKKRLQGIGLGVDHHRTLKVGQKPGAGKLNPAIEAKVDGRDILHTWIEKYVSLVQAIREQEAVLLKYSQLYHGLLFKRQPITLDAAVPGWKEFDPKQWWSNAIAMASFHPSVEQSLEEWTELVWRCIRFEFAAELADRNHPVTSILLADRASSHKAALLRRKLKSQQYHDGLAKNIVEGEPALREQAARAGVTFEADPNENDPEKARPHKEIAERLQAERVALLKGEVRARVSSNSIESQLRREIRKYLSVK